jgi:hypothetical protein
LSGKVIAESVAIEKPNNKEKKMKLSLLGLFVFGLASANAKVIWSENFDGRALGHDGVVVNANPVLGGTSSTIAAGEWAVHTDFTIADAGGGDHVLRLPNTERSVGAAIWLDVSTLGLSAGTTYQMEFTIANHVISGTGGKIPPHFANVLKAKGIDGDVEGDATVTWDLRTPTGFDDTVSAGGATIATKGDYLTSINPKNDDQLQWFNDDSVGSGNGTYAYDFTVAADDEYIGLIFGSADRNAESVAYDITNVSVTIPEPEPEPATLGLITA